MKPPRSKTLWMWCWPDGHLAVHVWGRRKAECLISAQREGYAHHTDRKKDNGRPVKVRIDPVK